MDHDARATSRFRKLRKQHGKPKEKKTFMVCKSCPKRWVGQKIMAQIVEKM